MDHRAEFDLGRAPPSSLPTQCARRTDRTGGRRTIGSPLVAMWRGPPAAERSTLAIVRGDAERSSQSGRVPLWAETTDAKQQCHRTQAIRSVVARSRCAGVERTSRQKKGVVPRVAGTTPRGRQPWGRLSGQLGSGGGLQLGYQASGPEVSRQGVLPGATEIEGGSIDPRQNQPKRGVSLGWLVRSACERGSREADGMLPPDRGGARSRGSAMRKKGLVPRPRRLGARRRHQARPRSGGIAARTASLDADRATPFARPEHVTRWPQSSMS
ncbi:hypothetical protein Pla163_01650 [Planctomycetes bacterium Pla163]|uniref:Uncharacterized protein n=1 Tax=Rohdeia mirabilis TaxID=2528008 RepID=A0A518CV14_9BACT|nr:hypothetical protein Pla163_01650 [Planctomycetes bacterium Pla163]